MVITLSYQFWYIFVVILEQMQGYGVRTMGLNILTAGNISRISKNKTMADKLTYIPNDDIQNYPLCRLQLVVEAFVHSS